VSPVGNRQVLPPERRAKSSSRQADCQSAKQQVANLRYFGCGSAALRACLSEVLRRGILAVAKAAREEHPRRGL